VRGALARLLLAQAVGQLCLVVAVVVLARLLAPSEMGLFQVGAAISVVLQPAATLCHEFRIPVARSNAEVAGLRRAGLVTLAVVAGLVLGVAVAAELLGSTAVATVSLTAAILLVAYAGTVLDNAVLIHHERRSALAVRNLLGGLLGAAFQVGGALLTGSAVVIASGVLVGRLLAIALTWTPVTTPHRGGAALSLRGSLLSVGSQSIWVLSMQTLTLLTAPFFGVVAAGYVGVAQRVAGAPTSLLGQALGQVSQSLLAPHVREPHGALRRTMLRQMAVLGSISSLLAVALIVLAPRGAAWVLGENYATVGVVAAILAVPFALQITAAPLAPFLIMIDRQAVLFRLQVIRAGVALSTVVGTALLSGNFLLTCLAYAVGESACYAACLVAVLREASRQDVVSVHG
jgi:O-antigen/teichoic acid export membrane protein